MFWQSFLDLDVVFLYKTRNTTAVMEKNLILASLSIHEHKIEPLIQTLKHIKIRLLST